MLPLYFLYGGTVPEDAILYYDADEDPYAELTGGASDLNYSVLNPQYQLSADGTYINVGAKPAIDFINGSKWLRSCGAVTNLASTTVSKDASVNVTDGWYDISGTIDAGDAVFVFYTGSLATDASKPFTGFFICEFKPEDVGKKIKYLIKRSFGTYAFASGEHTIVSGLNALAPLTFIQAADGYGVRLTISKENDTGYATIVKPVGWMITQSAYPVPYVPPGVTQPASNATTSGGVWFDNPLDSDLWKALDGQPLTLATRIKMGVGSGDLTTTINILAEKIGGTLLYSGDFGGIKRIVQSYDGSNTANKASTWPENIILRQVVQVNTAGTQFRVGYMIEGTHTTIQWGSWAAYDSSFNPSTLYRLMLGYNNPYYMGFNKIACWKRQVSDAELLEVFS